MNVTAIAPTGSAIVQGDLWGVHAGGYAEVLEPTFLPLTPSLPTTPGGAIAGPV